MTEEKSNRARGKLQLSNTKLNTILEITRAINRNAPRDELFQFLKSILIKDLEIHRFAFFTFEAHWRLSLTEGIDKEDVSGINIYSIINSYDTIDVIHDTSEIGTNKFDIVVPVFHNNQAFAYLLLADIKGEKIEISPIIKHLRFIQTLANIIVVALENKRLYQEEIKQMAVKKELETAQKMQSYLIPRDLPNNEFLKASAFYLPNSEVGGDYYDVIKLPENRTALIIADISGKGMSAALLMANFQANLRAQLDIAKDLEDLILRCNKKVIESANYEKFITLFIGIFDHQKYTFEYLNCGHQPGILVTSNEKKELKKGTTVLGMFDELPMLNHGIEVIHPNDKFICFTDGLSELEDEFGFQIESEGIKRLMSHDDSLDRLQDKIEDKIDELANISGLEDDVTYLIAEFLP